MQPSNAGAAGGTLAPSGGTRRGRLAQQFQRLDAGAQAHVLLLDASLDDVARGLRLAPKLPWP